MRRIALVLLPCLLWLPILAEGQGKVFNWTPPEHVAAPFGQVLRKTVLYVELVCSDEAGTVSGERGTAFIAAFQDSRLAEGQLFEYLVTNRHLAECWDDDKHPRTVRSFALRTNLKSGVSVSTPVPDLHWQFSQDVSADLAVAPIAPLNSTDLVVVPLNAFFTRDSFAAYNLGEGAKIILSGYFYQLEGEHHVQPIVREGILSMIPDEPLETTTGKRGPLYLGDVHVFGGNSGSPVFINTQGSITIDRGPQLMDDYHFLGIVSGYYYEDSEFKLQIAATVNVKQRANSGVSMIVPSDLIKDLILNNQQLKDMRDTVIANVQHK